MSRGAPASPHDQPQDAQVSAAARRQHGLRQHVGGAVNDHPHGHERQLMSGGDLRHADAFHVDRHGAGVAKGRRLELSRIDRQRAREQRSGRRHGCISATARLNCSRHSADVGNRAPSREMTSLGQHDGTGAQCVDRGRRPGRNSSRPRRRPRTRRRAAGRGQIAAHAAHRQQCAVAERCQAITPPHRRPQGARLRLECRDDAQQPGSRTIQ